MITQSVMPLKRMQHAVRKGYQCGDCGNLLTIAYGGAYGVLEDVLMCPGHPEHHTMAREAALSVMDTPDEYNPYSYTLSRLRREKLEKTLGIEKARSLAPMAGRRSLTQQQAAEIVETLWPGAPIIEKKKAILICAQYGLNPLMKHLFLVAFKKRKKLPNGQWVDDGFEWSLILGIRAIRIMAQDKGPYSYIDDTPRMMTPAEQEKILGAIDTSRYWAITKVKTPDGIEAPGTGNWPKSETVKGADKGNTPQNMALKRSEAAALERLHPGAMPTDFEVMDERYIPATVVDLGTGEIIEGSRAPELAEAPGDQGDAPPEDGSPPPPEGSTPVEKASTPEIKTLGDLFTRANKELHLSQSQVLAKLGLSSKDLIGDLGEAWQRLTA